MSTFIDEWSQIDWEAMGRANGWAVQRLDEVGYITMRARDGEHYCLRLECHGYPGQAPSATFADDKGSVQNLKAWPKGSGDFGSAVHPPPDPFICIPLTREGFAHHADWVTRPDAWSGEKSFLEIVNYVQRLLKGPTYGGRAA